MPVITGLHHICVPTTDPVEASEWYVQVFGFTCVLLEEREDEVVAAQLEHRTGCRLYLHRAPEEQLALQGFTLFSLTVKDRRALEDWAVRLSRMGISHARLREAHLGWALTVYSPDGLALQLHTQEEISAVDL